MILIGIGRGPPAEFTWVDHGIFFLPKLSSSSDRAILQLGIYRLICQNLPWSGPLTRDLNNIVKSCHRCAGRRTFRLPCLGHHATFHIDKFAIFVRCPIFYTFFHRIVFNIYRSSLLGVGGYRMYEQVELLIM